MSIETDQQGDSLERIEEDFEDLMPDFRNRFQKVLRTCEGKRYGSVEANRETAHRIQRLCNQMRLKIICPKTGLAGRLCFKEAGNAKHGIFGIDVYIEGRKRSKTNSVILPEMTLVDLDGQSLSQPELNIQSISDQMTVKLDSVVLNLQQFLNENCGREFQSFEEARSIATEVQALMQKLGVRAECPKTGLPANIRFKKSGNAKYGTFQFEVTEDGKRSVHAASTTFPEVKLIPAPEDKRKRNPTSSSLE